MVEINKINMIQELEDRAMIMELEFPNIINMDYSLLTKLNIPKEIELCDENGIIVINIDPNNP